MIGSARAIALQKNEMVKETGVLRQIGIISVKVMKNPGFWAIGLACSRMIGSKRAIATLAVGLRILDC